MKVADAEELPETAVTGSVPVAPEGIVNVLDGWHGELPSVEKVRTQESSKLETVTVTVVPGGPEIGLICRPTAEAGEAMPTTREQTSAARISVGVNLPPALPCRLEINVWAAPPFRFRFRAES